MSEVDAEAADADADLRLVILPFSHQPVGGATHTDAVWMKQTVSSTVY